MHHSWGKVQTIRGPFSACGQGERRIVRVSMSIYASLSLSMCAFRKSCWLFVRLSTCASVLVCHSRVHVCIYLSIYWYEDNDHVCIVHNVHVCMCVSMHAYMSHGSSASRHVTAYIRKYACTQTHTSICLQVTSNTHIHTYIKNTCIYTYMIHKFQVRFSFEEKTVLSTGLVDGLIIQWRLVPCNPNTRVCMR